MPKLHHAISWGVKIRPRLNTHICHVPYTVERKKTKREVRKEETLAVFVDMWWDGGGGWASSCKEDIKRGTL